MSKAKELLNLIEEINGEFGPYGFLSDIKVPKYKQYNVKSDIMQSVNGTLLDLSDKDDKISNLLNELPDMRVTVKFDKPEDHLAVVYPKEIAKVSKFKPLQKVYNDIVSKTLKKVKV